MSSVIKDLSPSTEIIVLTAHSETLNLIRAIEIGISHYVMKPIEFDQIFRSIDKSLAVIRSERLIMQQHEEIRALNADLAQKAVELEQANRELESFNYTVAHDLRSPMVCISGFCQLLLEKCFQDLDTNCKEWLETIIRETGRMNDIISALLNFSLNVRKQVEKKWADLSSMAREISASLQGQDLSRQATFCIADGINAYGDPDLLLVVLENLLGNAWKYSQKNADARIEFGTINKEDDLVYFVRDNGIGFDQALAKELFVPFQRLHQDDGFKGFGIGLATVERIIQRHGGRIWAESKKGQGATFYFTL
jgi:light-regulated signal transduction histidine kinase (bacteriophytochrome)